jgi:hypothetical protein
MDYHKKSEGEIEEMFRTNRDKGMKKTDALIKYYSGGKNKMRMKEKGWWDVLGNVLMVVGHPYGVGSFGVGVVLLVLRVLDDDGDLIGNDMSYFVAGAMMVNAVLFAGYRAVVKMLKRKGF